MFIENYRENNFVESLYIRVIRDNIKKYKNLKIEEKKENFILISSKNLKQKLSVCYKIIKTYKHNEKKSIKLNRVHSILKSNKEHLAHIEVNYNKENKGIMNKESNKKIAIKIIQI